MERGGSLKRSLGVSGGAVCLTIAKGCAFEAATHQSGWIDCPRIRKDTVVVPPGFLA
jgi:hypothetical protein